MRRAPSPPEARRSRTHDLTAVGAAARSRPQRPLGRLAAVGALVVAALLVACGDDTTATNDGNPPDATGDVQLLTYDAFALDDTAAAAFAKQSGRDIALLQQGDAGSMTARAVLSAGRPEGDVLFGVDNTLLTRALAAKLFEPLPKDILELVPQGYRVEGPGGDTVVAIDSGQVCVNADQAWFDERNLAVPTSLEDLTDARYRGLLVTQNAAASSPGLAFVLGTIAHFGEDGWQDYWKALKANGVRIAADWSDAYEAAYTVSGGDRPLVVSYGSSPPAEVFYSEGKRTRPQSSVIEATCVEQVEYAGVLAGTKRPEAGRQLVRFMLEDDFQRAIPLSNFVFPIRDVPVPEVFERFAVKSPDPLRLDPTDIATNRDRWTDEWRSITG